MQVKACLVGKSQPFVFPDDSELVSAVYHITASDKPSKEISLEMEHCATIETEAELSRLCFVTADSSTGPPYHFKYIDQGSKFSGSIGQIKVPHFSWLGIVWKKFSFSLQRMFCTTSYHALLYCENVEMTMKYLHFVLVKDLQACIEASLKRKGLGNEIIVCLFLKCILVICPHSCMHGKAFTAFCKTVLLSRLLSNTFLTYQTQEKCMTCLLL